MFNMNSNNEELLSQCLGARAEVEALAAKCSKDDKALLLKAYRDALRHYRKEVERERIRRGA